MEAKKAAGFTDKPAKKQGKQQKAGGEDVRGQSRERPHRPASEAYLQRAGLYYLQRFSSSVENFKAVMRRKIRKRGLAEGVTEETAEGWIDALAVGFERAELLDDKVFAEARAQSMFRKGKSQTVIRQTLMHKGVSADVVGDVLTRLFSDPADADLEAAIAFARRRRFGPFRTGKPLDVAGERRVLAAFARAGFSYAIAQRVLRAETEHAVAALIAD
jgi:regulatory protein